MPGTLNASSTASALARMLSADWAKVVVGAAATEKITLESARTRNNLIAMDLTCLAKVES